MRHRIPLAALAALVLAAPAARGNERHFSYTYETAVLPEGARELELWTTWRSGRDRYFSRFDHRVEIEAGVTDGLMTALYLNFSGQAEEDAAGERTSSFLYEGVSNEWKLKLSDPVADALGTGLYLELGASPDEYEIEAKLLLDKQLGRLLVAFNAVGELELELAEEGETEKEWVAAPVAAASYRVSRSYYAGVEVRNHTEIAEGEVEHSVLFAGPVMTYATESWWATVTFLPQLGDLIGGGHETTGHEKVEVRLLLATHL